MNLIKVKFVNADGEPKGRAYTYNTPERLEVKVGDIVVPKASAKGIVTEVNVPGESITFPLDKLQTIIGLAEQKVKGFDVQPEQKKPECYSQREDNPSFCKGNDAYACDFCKHYEDYIPPVIEQ